MQTALVNKIERNIDRVASWSFAAACGYAAYVWFSAHVAQPTLGAETGGVVALAYLCCSRALASVQPQPRRAAVPVFSLRDYEAPELDELLLTERYQKAEEPLVLDDILARLGPDSRVVRLFDPAAMPTPAQLKSRIDRHLGDEGAHDGSGEAAHALHEALAQLRRSMR